MNDRQQLLHSVRKTRYVEPKTVTYYRPMIQIDEIFLLRLFKNANLLWSTPCCVTSIFWSEDFFCENTRIRDHMATKKSVWFGWSPKISIIRSFMLIMNPNNSKSQLSTRPRSRIFTFWWWSYSIHYLYYTTSFLESRNIEFLIVIFFVIRNKSIKTAHKQKINTELQKLSNGFNDW